MPLYRNEFHKIFSELLVRADISSYKIGKYTEIDEAYLSRLRNGRKNNPSVETVMKIGLALAHLGEKISLHDIEELFNSIGRSINLK